MNAPKALDVDENNFELELKHHKSPSRVCVSLPRQPMPSKPQQQTHCYRAVFQGQGGRYLEIYLIRVIARLLSVNLLS